MDIKPIEEYKKQKIEDYANNPDYQQGFNDGMMLKVLSYAEWLDIDDYFYANKQPFGKDTFLFEPWPKEMESFAKNLYKFGDKFNANEANFWIELKHIFDLMLNNETIEQIFPKFTKQQQNFILNAKIKIYDTYKEPIFFSLLDDEDIENKIRLTPKEGLKGLNRNIKEVARSIYERREIERKPLSKDEYEIWRRELAKKEVMERVANSRREILKKVNLDVNESPNEKLQGIIDEVKNLGDDKLTNAILDIIKPEINRRLGPRDRRGVK